MSSPPREVDASSMFMQKGDGSAVQHVEKNDNNSRKASLPPEVITVKDFFDFMKTAYQVYEHLEGDDDEAAKINWDKLTKLTVINHVIEQQERDLLKETVNADPKPSGSKSETGVVTVRSECNLPKKRLSCSEIEGVWNRNVPPDIKVEMLGIWTEANLNCKLNDGWPVNSHHPALEQPLPSGSPSLWIEGAPNDPSLASFSETEDDDLLKTRRLYYSVINEGILDSILPYLVGYRKPSKTTSVYTPVIKKSDSTDVKKQASFGGFLDEKDSKDRLGRRKSAVFAAQEQAHKQEGEVEIHVCDEVKGLKKDFKCPQKLLISKMGYFADVTAGQRLEDMDISVHCDIQIFDWLMRWVKRDTILVADWPLLEPTNVVPILVSASFLQMEPLLHDCLIYCHAHMSEIVKTATNLACLSDALLTRLAAMYTNVELEQIRDRKDKIQSRLYCKMILSLAEPVPETIRGHYASLANLFKCTKCNKLLGQHIAEQVPCQPSSMRIDRRGNVLSTHNKDPTWNLNEYITWLYGDLRSWRRVYWRLWADCHFLKCQLCDNFFPIYQMEWCSYHEQMPHMFHIEGRPPLPSGKYPCCGESAYRFETISRNTGCQFREHAPNDMLPKDASVMEVYNKFRDLIAIRPPQLKFPERIPKFVAREPDEETNGRLECKEVFWWEGIQLVPQRQPFGLLGKMYSSNNKFNPSARPGSPPQPVATKTSSQSLTGGQCSSVSSPPTDTEQKALPAPTTLKDEAPSKKGTTVRKGSSSAGHGDEQSDSSSDSDEDSDTSEASQCSEEDSPPRNRTRVAKVNSAANKKRTRVVGRQWVTSLSARSNQDGQRRYEERALRQMRAALARRTALSAQRPRAPPGGVYARLEVEWRERHGQPVSRARTTAVPMRQRQQIKYK